MWLLCTRDTLQLFVAQLKSLPALILQPIRFTHIKTSFPRKLHCCIKVWSTLEFLLKPSVLFELGKKG